MGNGGTIGQQFRMGNNTDSWNEFMERYLYLEPEIALEVSTTGKYCTRMLRDMGFSVHMADPVKLSLIFNTSKKNDKEDSYKLAKLLRLGELPEVHLPSKEADDLRSIVRYRKSLGDEITEIKNRVHAVLGRYGISIDATDIFGKRGLSEIERSSEKMSASDRIIVSDMIERIRELKDRESTMEDEIARMCHERNDVKLLMTIPGINVYSAAAIVSEIDDVSRFESKEKLASYAGLVPKQDQSGGTDYRGHITKHGPSMIRFILVNAAHHIIKYSGRMKKKYLSIVRRVGMKRAIVAVARKLLEIIWTMLSRGVEFVDHVDALTEKKMKAMSARASKPRQAKELKDTVKLIREDRLQGMSRELFS